MSVSDFPYPGNEIPRALPSLPDGVALWWCELTASDAALPALGSWLSAAEHARRARFGTGALAARYTIGRSALRWVLARTLGIEPAQVPIERGARGRPRLAGAFELDFNLSHTRGAALIGIVRDAAVRIGVDLEHADRAVHHVGLARKFLTPREQAAITGLDDDAHRRAFLRLWSCKEAMAKATGDALAAPMRTFDVTLEPSLRLVDGPAPYTPADWILAPADVPAGFIGTVARWRPRAGRLR